MTTFNAKNVNYVRTRTSRTRPVRGMWQIVLMSVSRRRRQVWTRTVRKRMTAVSISVGLLLTRRQYVRRPSNPAVAADVMRADLQPPTKASDVEHPSHESAPDKTSVFAHPVDDFVSNFEDKDLLKRMPLKIGEHTATWVVLQEDRAPDGRQAGTGYWGKIKVRITRTELSHRFWRAGSGSSRRMRRRRSLIRVNVYLSKKLIDNYRKRKAFLEEIKHAIDGEAELY